MASTMRQLRSEFDLLMEKMQEEIDKRELEEKRLKRELELKSAENEDLKKNLESVNTSLQEVNACNSTLKESNKRLSKLVDELIETNKNVQQNQLESVKSSPQTANDANASRVENNESFTQNGSVENRKREETREVNEIGHTVTSSAIIRVKFIFSKIDLSKHGGLIRSAPTVLNGIQWCLVAKNYRDEFLYVLIEGKPIADDTTCTVKMEFQLISQEDDRIVILGKLSASLRAGSEEKERDALAFGGAYPMDRLNEKDQKFVKDDSIILAVSMDFIRVNGQRLKNQ